jgi:hypothetical protein
LELNGTPATAPIESNNQITGDMLISEYRKIKITAIVSIVVAIIGVSGAIVTALVTHIDKKYESDIDLINSFKIDFYSKDPFTRELALELYTSLDKNFERKKAINVAFAKRDVKQVSDLAKDNLNEMINTLPDNSDEKRLLANELTEINRCYAAIGTYSNIEYFKSLLNKMRKTGYKGKLEIYQDSLNQYVGTIGQFENREAAMKALADLTDSTSYLTPDVTPMPYCSVNWGNYVYHVP